MTPEKLKECRKRVKMTQQEIGDTFGVTARYWRGMERGEFPVQPWVIWALKGLFLELKIKWN